MKPPAGIADHVIESLVLAAAEGESVEGLASMAEWVGMSRKAALHAAKEATKRVRARMKAA